MNIIAFALAKKKLNRLFDVPTDNSFFDITSGGIVSLKSAYRGSAPNTTYSYAVSDNGAKKDGSLIGELPEKIVIPESINGVTVTGLQQGMFHSNLRIKEIVFPDGVTTAPKALCYGAIHLDSIRNTEHITSIDEAAFQRTAIRKALFPNLTNIGKSAFDQCMRLTTADIGTVISDIPYRCFQGNKNLSVIKGGNNVTSIGERAFMNTMSLKNLPFLKNVKSFGNYAFFNCRIQFDWNSLPDNVTFGTFAYPTKDNFDNGVDYWTGCTWKAHNVPLITAWNQRHPDWGSLYWGSANNTYKQLYSEKGCGAMMMMHIHSSLSGKKYSSPKKFESELESLENGAEFLTLDCTKYDTYVRVFEALGYELIKIEDAITKENMQTIYDEMAKGACAFAGMSVSTNETAVNHGNHAIMLYGVNEFGEVLVLDSDNGAHLHEGYDDLKLLTYSVPLQNITGFDSNILIVKKKN